MPERDLNFHEDDLPYEEEILRNPYSVKCWLRYVEHKEGSPAKEINMVFERALKELPGSYKLWYAYLRLRRSQLKGLCINDPMYEDVNNAHERALVFMHKMPRIWIDYCKLLVEQMKLTRIRRTFDRALRALPITQHTRVWPLYLNFVKKYPVHETAVRVYRRMLKLQPEDAEDYIEYLISIDRLDEACVKLAEIVNDEHFLSKRGKSNHALWHELCTLISRNPDKVHSLNVEAIIRGGLKRFTDQLGQLWCSLADYYTRSGLFERARDIYEEAIETVTTVRDFTQIFDAYAQFEETVISSKMEQMTNNPSDDQDEDDTDIELRLARFEHLMDRRPLLLNSVLLRQNPHNVLEWLKRVELFKDQPREIINTYTEAIQTIDVKKSVGKLYTLWVSFAKFYESNDQIQDVSQLLVYIFSLIMHVHLSKTLNLILMVYADLEESFGTLKTCKAVYDKILDLRIATPQIIINYGMFLEENNYFEDAFKAYERGVALFKWPNVYDIWNTYLTKFIKRYGGKKLERARDLFEQALDGCPAKFAKNLYLLYAKLEEEYGLSRHAMAVYERATKAVLTDQRHELFNIYLRRAAEIYGVTHTRPIYEKAIEVLPDEHARDFCLRFADLERKLGEIDRARAVYAHCSQMCDPRTSANFWEAWKSFEVKHGNEDTVREMLRIKRSVQATYNTQVNYMSAQMLAAAGNLTGTTSDLTPDGNLDNDGMKLLEQKASHAAARANQEEMKPNKGILFVRSDKPPMETEISQVQNPDEIDIDDDDSETEDGPAVIQRKIVPDEVFGGMKKDED
uniref:pre-mRNA-splicing factor SYF1 n=1 Tax=Ciona intestinalis TaxID=7719 RepID=UPI000EF4589C|nr:pre-mRNA-splicing factor SYF1 [Ciona intestinalis]|eukprot:XP_026690906.1 pre-mRNA-splicing factor SYF1 [Ciona intestinalis]